MGISVIGGSGAGAEVFETLQHSSGTFTVDCSTNKTVVLDINNAYFTPSFATPTFVGGKSDASSLGSTISTYTVSLTSLSGGIASAPAAGDLVIVAVNAATDQSRLMSFPGDWTVISSVQSSDTHWTNLRVAYKRMGTSPDTSVVVSGSLFADFSISYAVHVWRNINEATPLDVTAQTNSALNTSSTNPPAITTATNNAVVLAVGAGAFANVSPTAYSTPANLTNFTSTAAQDNNSTVIGMGSYIQATAGTFDPDTFGGAPTSSAASSASVTLALRPALGATNTATINFTNIPLERKELTVNLSRSNAAISAVPLVWQNGIVGFSAKTSLPIGGAIIEKFFTLGNTLYADSFASPAAIKKIDYFSSSGSWTAPAGVTYVNYTLVSGGGGGGGNVANTYATRGGASSFAGVTHEGGEAGTNGANGGSITADNAAANTGNGGGAGGTTSQASGTSGNAGGSSIPKTLGMAVTPGQSYAVVVGAGGAKGQPTGGNGGSGWVTVEYWMAG